MAPWNQPDGCVGIKRRNEDLVERSVCPGCHGSNHYCKKRLCADNSLLVNEDGQTPLHVLCQDRCSSMEEVQNTVASFPEALELRDVYGRSVRLTLSRNSLVFLLVLFTHVRLSALVCSHFSTL